MYVWVPSLRASQMITKLYIFLFEIFGSINQPAAFAAMLYHRNWPSIKGVIRFKTAIGSPYHAYLLMANGIYLKILLLRG